MLVMPDGTTRAPDLPADGLGLHPRRRRRPRRQKTTVRSAEKNFGIPDGYRRYGPKSRIRVGVAVSRFRLAALACPWRVDGVRE